MDLVSLKKDIEGKRKKANEQQTDVATDFIKKVQEQAKNVEAEEIKKKKEETDVKVVPRVITFDIEYNFNGINQKVKLTSKVMDAEARTKYDRYIGIMSNGFVFDFLPTETQNRYAALARIMSQLIDPPEWLLKACSEDLEFAFNLTLQLLEHEKRFFRYTPLAGSEATEKPRFSINTTAFND